MYYIRDKREIIMQYFQTTANMTRIVFQVTRKVQNINVIRIIVLVYYRYST